jgi:hypothetical protein
MSTTKIVDEFAAFAEARPGAIRGGRPEGNKLSNLDISMPRRSSALTWLAGHHRQLPHKSRHFCLPLYAPALAR